MHFSVKGDHYNEHIAHPLRVNRISLPLLRNKCIHSIVVSNSCIAKYSLFYFTDKERTVIMSEIKKVAVIMGSDSDFPVVRKAAEVLKEFGVPFELHVLSAHRSPKEVAAFASTARENGFGVIIAAAGMAAHLAGAVAGNTTLPVIGIPVKAKALEGMDALLATVMMPPGVPVATVGVDGAANAGYLAVEILSVANDELAEKLAAFKKKQNEKNLEADRRIQEEAAKL